MKRKIKKFLFKVGKRNVFWCDYCNIPVLINQCPKCGEKTKILKISPPKDLKPAWEYDLQLIRKAIDDDYGHGIGSKIIPNNKVIMLNKITGIDAANEVIVDGKVIGIIMYDIQKWKWQFIPKIEGARRIHKYNGKKWIKVDEEAAKRISNKMNVLSVGVTDLDDSICKGDYVYIVTPNDEVIAVGKARGSCMEIKGGSINIAVKTKYADIPREACENKVSSSWEEVVYVNREYIMQKIKLTCNFITEVSSKNRDLPQIVAFSGGKDSACTLSLVLECLGDSNVKIVFLDTGLEFPETVRYTVKLMEDLGLRNNFIYETASDVFWKKAKEIGPPSRDYRWCCKVCKLNLMSKIIKKELGGKCLTFTGQRMYESMSRAYQPKVTVTIQVPGQVKASPIQDWNALEVWLFLSYKRIKVNPLYFMGFDRIGCYMCPASDLADFENVKKIHPNIWERWEEFLKEWAMKHGFNNNWIKYGLWRWRRLPGYWKSILKG